MTGERTRNLIPFVHIAEVARSSAPIERGQASAALFYLYVENLAAARDHLEANGVPVGEIRDGSPGPRREMGLSDPDGWCLMVAEVA
jgi:hypothetical protein